MRAPFQILAIPYHLKDGEPVYCVFHRADFGQWQFIAGGGEDSELPLEAAKREIFEETGVVVRQVIQLDSMCSIPCNIFAERLVRNWPDDTFVIPEHAFGFACDQIISLSSEHTEYAWLPYEEACKVLKWDSNRTALYELNARLLNRKPQNN